jgi:hypothetical protein
MLRPSYFAHGPPRNKSHQGERSFRRGLETFQILAMDPLGSCRYLLAAAFTEAATRIFSTIAITNMTAQLGFDARENGIAIGFCCYLECPAHGWRLG